MKLKTLRMWMMLLLLAEAALLIYRWYEGNAGWSSRANWVFIPVTCIAFLWKSLSKRHRCPHCGKHLDWKLDFKKITRCPQCGELIE